MIDREKVIKGLECIGGYMHMANNPCTDCEYNECQTYAICVGEVARDALELLKEQEAKMPIVRENSYGWKFYYCPRCGKEFYQNRKQKFCDKCGQEVKWDG